MKRPSLPRLAAAAAALSLWGVVRSYRKKKRVRTPNGGTPREWPADVRAFLRLLHERGAQAVNVRREDAYGPPRWVVEWGRGRSLTFPDNEGG